MKSLIWEDHKQWNVSLLDELFSYEEVELIQGIPLSIRNIADRRVWHYDRHGTFTAWSAYHVSRGLLVTSGEGNAGSHSAASANREKFCKKLWSACVPGKVKICVWSSCLDSLPTKVNLCKQRVSMEDGCVVCGGHVESVEHVL